MLISLGVIWTSNLFAFKKRIPDLESRLYNPFENISLVSFSLKAPSGAELLNNKLISKSKLSDTFKVSYLGDEVDIKIDIEDDTLRQIVKENLRPKTYFQQGPRLKTWLTNYEFIEEDNGQYVYSDPTGLRDTQEIRVYFLNKTLKVIEKRATGTIRTEYKYKVTPWSNNQLVLDTVLKSSFEGTQSIKTQTIVKYSKIKDLGYVPTEVNFTTTQKLYLDVEQKVERIIKEDYFFSDFKFKKL